RRAGEERADDAGGVGDEADQRAGPFSAGSLPCADVWPRALLRHQQGEAGTGLDAALLERGDVRRELRMVPPSSRSSAARPRREPPSFGGEARSAGAGETILMNSMPKSRLLLAFAALQVLLVVLVFRDA